MQVGLRAYPDAMTDADEYGQEVDAARMLAELDWPSGAEHRDAILAEFASTLDPIRRMLGEISFRRDAHPQQKFGIVHLMTRSLSDLLAGGHLAAHCYLPPLLSGRHGQRGSDPRSP